MTYDEARDEMQAIVKTVADAQSITLRYPDIPGDPPATEVVWARVSVLHATGRQGSLTGAHARVRWERQGTLWIELYSPAGDGNAVGYAKSQEFINALQSYRGDIWFRNVHMQEQGPDGAWQRFDVKATFQYDDVR
jgi:hypothetical protein